MHMAHSTSMSMTSPNQNSLHEPDESTRLLPDAERGGITEVSQARGPTPRALPKAQLGALISVRIVDSIASTQILPYINQLLADLHIAAPEQVGFYSGFIGSAYSLAEMFSVYQLGRLSDVVGRRPVVISCLVGIVISTIAFGLSTSLLTILASRLFGGLAAGNIAVHHSILVEITDDSNQNIAVPIYSLAWSTGTVVGPLISGTFANAATRYTTYFSWPLFVDYPHLPPCIITAVCALLGIVLAYFLIEETLPSKRKGAADSVPGSAPHSASDTDATSGSSSVKALLAIPALRALTLSGLALSFLSSSFEVVFTLFCYTPVDAGGLGLQPSTIGKFLASSGTFAVLLRLVAMPYILRRFDYATTYNTCMYLWPIAFAFLPLLNMLAVTRHHAQSELPHVTRGEIGTATTAEMGIWIGLALMLALARVAAIPYTVTMLLIKRHAPTHSTPSSVEITSTGSGFRSMSALGPPGSKTGTTTATNARGTGSALGRSNGLVQFAMCLGRSIGPVVVSTLFTALNGSTWARQWGVTWAWSVIMVCVAVVGARLAKGIR
ncbi:major facilitator superfamily domain-containing protein [Boletus edulis]|nr:major facilitator superfamily domain-containing protein [Boletus edulis]